MDLNQKYADHQRAVMRASATLDSLTRDNHLSDAFDIAGQIGAYQRKLGAAASCAWSARKSGNTLAGAVTA